MERRVDWTWHLDMPGLKLLLEPVLAPVMQRQAQGLLANLKEMLESRGSVSSPLNA